MSKNKLPLSLPLFPRLYPTSLSDTILYSTSLSRHLESGWDCFLSLKPTSVTRPWFVNSFPYIPVLPQVFFLSTLTVICILILLQYHPSLLLTLYLPFCTLEYLCFLRNNILFMPHTCWLSIPLGKSRLSCSNVYGPSPIISLVSSCSNHPSFSVLNFIKEPQLFAFTYDLFCLGQLLMCQLNFYSCLRETLISPSKWNFAWSSYTRVLFLVSS